MTIEICNACNGKGYVKGVACANCGGAGTKVPSEPVPRTAPTSAPPRPNP